jgi:hypothetical protein
MPKKKPEPAVSPERALTDAIYAETASVLRARKLHTYTSGNCTQCGRQRMHYACFVAGPWNALSRKGTTFVMHTIYACQVCHPMHEGREWTADDGG